MSEKPIWTFWGDIAIELEHALPNIKKAKVLAAKNGDSKLEDHLWEIELRIQANLKYSSRMNRARIMTQSLDSTQKEADQ